MGKREKAQRAAERRAPLPKTEPLYGGAIGAFAVACTVALFAGFAGLNVQQMGGAVYATAALGFAVPWVYLQAKRKEHYRVFEEELSMRRSSDHKESGPVLD